MIGAQTVTGLQLAQENVIGADGYTGHSHKGNLLVQITAEHIAANHVAEQDGRIGGEYRTGITLHHKGEAVPGERDGDIGRQDAGKLGGGVLVQARIDDGSPQASRNAFGGEITVVQFFYAAFDESTGINLGGLLQGIAEISLPENLVAQPQPYIEEGPVHIGEKQLLVAHDIGHVIIGVILEHERLFQISHVGTRIKGGEGATVIGVEQVQ